jgi:hypothetical protein
MTIVPLCMTPFPVIIHVPDLKKETCGDTVSQTVLINVYHAKFESVLKYGIIFWGGDHKDFKDIFKLQKKCIRVIK